MGWMPGGLQAGADWSYAVWAWSSGDGAGVSSGGRTHTMGRYTVPEPR